MDTFGDFMIGEAVERNAEVERLKLELRLSTQQAAALRDERDRLRTAMITAAESADDLLEDLQMDGRHDAPWYSKAVNLVAAMDAALAPSAEPKHE